MKLKKTLLFLLPMLLLGGSSAFSQVPPCDPAAQQGQPGSCQFPNQDFPNGGPDCYVCQAIIGGPNVCVPDDTFCEGMAGGDSNPNVCRIAFCDPNATSRGSNPTGCEYFIDPSPTPIPQCFQCNDDTAPFDNHCPNGACEPGLGENPTSCPEDCLVPGMSLPLPSQAEMDNACVPPSITFNGPPFNVGNTGFCEDGNVCTTDTCVGGTTCDHTDNGCSLDTSDLCCPSTCSAPPAGGTCGNDTGCDVDCKEIACPLPTPSPTPPPFAGCLEGGGGWGEKNGPGCGGAACALNPAASAVPGLSLAFSLAGLFGFGAYRNLRRRRD